MAPKKSILIVDDHPLFREGLKALIERKPGFSVVGEAGTAREGLALATELKPELAVVDISLPDGSGIELTRSIRGMLPHTRVLIVSMHSKIQYITEALQAGANGYVVKESAADRLIQGLEAVSQGEYFLDSSLSQSVVKRLVDLPEQKVRVSDKSYGTLTAREQQVLRMVAEGRSTKDIAADLFISPKTVENHRANIMEKLNLHNTIELVRYAAKLGLIDIDLWKQ
ncbi:MAG TPA: DNA-binding response regulator [Syntrophobacteraceae bacterium]|jgi:DNA-binding NarL/FixJ family response regulator|nr:DNA-binding response regulator [Syntrophobacteraceae bacterium]HBD10210.1 DNA-binding response regulator [Syntrophobacteraceae bacterium]HBZ57090.1 DNA-binding response regulator [Syntrophobacteraceae bacterium]